MNQLRLIGVNDYSNALSRILYDESMTDDQRILEATKYIVSLHDSTNTIYSGFRILANDYVTILSSYSRIANIITLMRRSKKHSHELHTAFKKEIKDFIRRQLEGKEVQFKRNFVTLIRDYGLNPDQELLRDAFNEYLNELTEG